MASISWVKALGLAAVVVIGQQAIAQSASSPPADAPTPAHTPRPMLSPGYLKAPALSADVGLSPAPPAAGSAAEARDLEGAKDALAFRGGPRWVLATADADLFGPDATRAFSCAAGVDIGAKATPRLDALLRKTLADFGMSTSAIKRKFQRPRPFMVTNSTTCTPDSEPMLRKDGSYPSGHSAIGYGWSLILATLMPDRAAQLVARGRAFGDSRRICNAHWLSDVEEGRIAAATIFARLNADPVFRQDMDAVRAELQTAAAPPRACDKETAALNAGR